MYKAWCKAARMDAGSGEQYHAISPKYSRAVPRLVVTTRQPAKAASRFTKPGVSYQLTRACKAQAA